MSLGAFLGAGRPGRGIKLDFGSSLDGRRVKDAAGVPQLIETARNAEL